MHPSTDRGVLARDLRTEELIDCLSINTKRIGDELVERSQAIGIWKKLTLSPGWSAAVIEAPDARAGNRIIGFGCDILVSAAFVEAEISNPRPGLNSRIIANIHEHRPVVLTEAEIRLGNAGEGVDIAILYGSWVEGLTRERFFEVRESLTARFTESRRGFRINRMITETIGDLETGQFLATHAWREISKFDKTGADSSSFMMMTREDALAVAASLVASVFRYQEPVFRLRRAEQELLVAAIGGLTDEELSRKLCLTLAAVKKRWISIFERTVHARPDLFPPVDQKESQKRSRQKRHLVLSFVRSHPEELRPTL